MVHLDTENQVLEVNITEMWHMILSQLSKSQLALSNFDKNIVKNVQVNDKMIKTYKLKIDKDCENTIIHINNEIVNLRFVLVVLKINHNLERISDYAYNISKLIDEMESPFSEELLKSSRIMEMYDIILGLLVDTLASFENKNKEFAKTVFGKDKILNKINKVASQKVADYIISKPSEVKMAMNTLSIIRKLERVGDYILNITKELSFFMEASEKKMPSKN